MVTIAIASYNNSKYIKRCIESCINQSYSDLEILIIDDGSTDDTKNVCETYSSNSAITFISKENGGLSSSRQKAIDIASGEYICFIDADDCLDEDYILSMHKCSVKTKSDICVCNTDFYQENGERISTPSIYDGYVDDFFQQDIYSKMDKDFIKLARFFTMCDSWNKMYRTSFLRENHLSFIFPKGYNGSDLLFNHKVLMYKPKICTCSYHGYNHFIYKNSATGRKNKKMQEGNEIIWNSLYKESIKAGMDKVIFGQLSYLYFCLLRDAFQDEMLTTNYSFESLKHLVARSSLFEKNNQIKKKGVFFGDLKLYIFYVIRKRPLLLMKYLKLRGRPN